MKSWTTKEAKLVFEWARSPIGVRSQIDEIARQLGRSVGSVKQFLRRLLPRGQRPWIERPRWTPAEISAVEGGAKALSRRSSAAIENTCSGTADKQVRLIRLMMPGSNPC